MPPVDLDPSAPHIILILMLIGVLFGVINTLAGGGSVLSLPALLLLGLPPHAANATNEQREARWAGTPPVLQYGPRRTTGGMMRTQLPGWWSTEANGP